MFFLVQAFSLSIDASISIALVFILSPFGMACALFVVFRSLRFVVRSRVAATASAASEICAAVAALRLPRACGGPISFSGVALHGARDQSRQTARSDVDGLCGAERRPSR